MMYRFEWLPLWVRVFGYFGVYVIIWSIISIPFILSEDHAGFQSAGTIIICWAIFVIGRDRLRFEKTIQAYEHASVIAAVNRFEAHRKVNEKRLDLTFKMHQLSISQILFRLKMHNPMGIDTIEEINDLGREIEAEFAQSPSHYTIEEDASFQQAITSLQRIKPEFQRWGKYSFTCEISFLVIGTLQTGYGATFSALLSQVGMTSYLNDLLT